MIPYGGSQNTSQGKKVLLYIFGGLTLVLLLGAGIFDGKWDNVGMWILCGGFFFVGWLQGKFPG